MINTSRNVKGKTKSANGTDKNSKHTLLDNPQYLTSDSENDQESIHSYDSFLLNDVRPLHIETNLEDVPNSEKKLNSKKVLNSSSFNTKKPPNRPPPPPLMSHSRSFNLGSHNRSFRNGNIFSRIENQTGDNPTTNIFEGIATANNGKFNFDSPTQLLKMQNKSNNLTPKSSFRSLTPKYYVDTFNVEILDTNPTPTTLTSMLNSISPSVTPSSSFRITKQDLAEKLNNSHSRVNSISHRLMAMIDPNQVDTSEDENDSNHELQIISYNPHNENPLINGIHATHVSPTTSTKKHQVRFESDHQELSSVMETPSSSTMDRLFGHIAPEPAAEKPVTKNSVETLETIETLLEASIEDETEGCITQDLSESFEFKIESSDSLTQTMDNIGPNVGQFISPKEETKGWMDHHHKANLDVSRSSSSDPYISTKTGEEPHRKSLPFNHPSNTQPEILPSHNISYSAMEIDMLLEQYQKKQDLLQLNQKIQQMQFQVDRVDYPADRLKRRLNIWYFSNGFSLTTPADVAVFVNELSNAKDPILRGFSNQKFNTMNDWSVLLELLRHFEDKASSATNGLDETKRMDEEEDESLSEPEMIMKIIVKPIVEKKNDLECFEISSNYSRDVIAAKLSYQLGLPEELLLENLPSIICDKIYPPSLELIKDDFLLAEDLILYQENLIDDLWKSNCTIKENLNEREVFVQQVTQEILQLQHELQDLKIENRKLKQVIESLSKDKSGINGEATATTSLEMKLDQRLDQKLDLKQEQTMMSTIESEMQKLFLSEKDWKQLRIKLILLVDQSMEKFIKEIELLRNYQKKYNFEEFKKLNKEKEMIEEVLIHFNIDRDHLQMEIKELLQNQQYLEYEKMMIQSNWQEKLHETIDSYEKKLQLLQQEIFQLQNEINISFSTQDKLITNLDDVKINTTKSQDNGSNPNRSRSNSKNLLEILTNFHEPSISNENRHSSPLSVDSAADYQRKNNPSKKLKKKKKEKSSTIQRLTEAYLKSIGKGKGGLRSTTEFIEPPHTELFGQYDMIRIEPDHPETKVIEPLTSLEKVFGRSKSIDVTSTTPLRKPNRLPPPIPVPQKPVPFLHDDDVNYSHSFEMVHDYNNPKPSQKVVDRFPITSQPNLHGYLPNFIVNHRGNDIRSYRQRINPQINLPSHIHAVRDEYDATEAMEKPLSNYNHFIPHPMPVEGDGEDQVESVNSHTAMIAVLAGKLSDHPLRSALRSDLSRVQKTGYVKRPNHKQATVSLTSKPSRYPDSQFLHRVDSHPQSMISKQIPSEFNTYNSEDEYHYLPKRQSHFNENKERQNISPTRLKHFEKPRNQPQQNTYNHKVNSRIMGHTGSSFSRVVDKQQHKNAGKNDYDTPTRYQYNSRLKVY